MVKNFAKTAKEAAAGMVCRGFVCAIYREEAATVLGRAETARLAFFPTSLLRSLRE